MNINLDTLENETSILKETIRSAIKRFNQETKLIPGIEIKTQSGQLSPCCAEQIIAIKVKVFVEVNEVISA